MKWSKLFKILDMDKGFLNVTGGNMISAAIMSFLWLLLASILGVENYGHLNYFISIAIFASVLSTLGLRITVMTYLSKGEETLQQQANLLVLLSTCLVFIPLLLIIQNIPTAILFFGISFYNMTLAEMLGRRNHKKFFFLKVGSRLLLVPISIVLFFVMGIDGILWGYALATLLFSYSFFKSLKNMKFQFSALRKKLHFILSTYLVTIVTRGSDLLDKLLIGSIFGFEMLGFYQLGFQFLILLSILPISLAQFLIPQEAAGLERKKTEKFGITISIILAISAYFILPVVISNIFPDFVNAIPAAQLLVLTAIPATINAIIKSRFWGREQTKPVIISSSIKLTLLLGLLIFFGNYLGLIGLSLAILISEILQTMVLLVLTQKFKKIH